MSDFQINLAAMLQDMDAAPPEFRPTNFWSSGLPTILKDIETHGVENFRVHPSAAFFYVPLYASRTWQRGRGWLEPLVTLLPQRKRARMLMRLTRSDRARVDYRMYRATAVQGGLDLDCVSESDAGGGERFTFDKKSYSRSMLNYLRALNLYKTVAKGVVPNGCLEIGGGYGTLGEILLKAAPSSLYVNVDIPPVAAVSTWYLEQVFGADSVLGYAQSREMDSINLDALRQRYRAIILCPWQLPRVAGMVDLFANFMSFQEMEPNVVANYVALVKPLIGRHVLMRNSAVGKKIAQRPGEIGVIQPVLSGFVQELFTEFETRACDAFVYGEENETGSYRSEVCVMERTAGI